MITEDDLWVQVPEHPRFEISLVSKEIRRKKTGKIRKQWIGGGRAYVRLFDGADYYTLSVSRILGEILFGPLEPGVMVRHWNDDPLDNRLCNLVPGSRSNNERDKIRNGKNHHARKTHCPHGHEYTSYSRPNGRTIRVCKTCKQDSNKKRKEAKCPMKLT